MLLLRCGQVEQLAAAGADGIPQTAHAMEELLQQLPPSGQLGGAGGQLPYEWLPRPALAATINLLTARIMQPGGERGGLWV